MPIRHSASTIAPVRSASFNRLICSAQRGQGPWIRRYSASRSGGRSGSMAHSGPRGGGSHRPGRARRAAAARRPKFFAICVASTVCGVRMDRMSHIDTVAFPRFSMTDPRPGRHALIIEDEMLIALEVESLLHDFGFESCDIVDNPKDAVKSAMAHRPDLVTADLRIVGGTG